MSQLAAHAAALGVPLSAAQLAQFATYRALLIEWNARFNLTRISEPEGIDVRHFLDGLSCALVTGDLNGRALIDVGTGAGFPGLPLKIYFPQLRLTLVDSVQKKTLFLRAVVEALGLHDVTVLAERAETLGQQRAHRAQYDWAVGRAVAQMAVLAEYLLPLVRVGGALLAQKGSSAAAETAAAAPAIALLGGGAATIRAVTLPQRDEAHYLVSVPKIKPTPAAYPRRAGLPAKRPLGIDADG